jgi:hypothetical protein
MPEKSEKSYFPKFWLIEVLMLLKIPLSTAQA